MWKLTIKQTKKTEYGYDATDKIEFVSEDEMKLLGIIHEISECEGDSCTSYKFERVTEEEKGEEA